MKKILIVILFLSLNYISAQNVTKNISITFDNVTRIDVIKLIEEQTNYHFYFVENWLGKDLISGSYNNVSLKTILNDIFKKTVINFYITADNKVILTRNNIIYDSLPIANIGTVKKEIILEEENKPIFVIKETSNVNRNTTPVIRIGKENKYSKRKRYTLSGYVRDLITKRPIPYLALIVKNKNLNTITDSTGYYSFRLPVGENLIETKALGFQNSKKRVIIYGDGTLNFELTESLERLTEIVLEADVDKNVKEAKTGITKIRTEDIKNIPLVLGTSDILKVATTLPGISTAGEGSTGFNVRGGKEDQNLILLDYGVLYNPAHFFGIFSALNPFTTGSVNIYKGNIPVEYGGRLSSVFEINTKKGSDEKFSGEASIGPVTSNVALEIPVVKDKSSLVIGGRGTYSNWLLNLTDDQSVKNSDASFYDGVIKYNHKINDNNNLESTGYYSKDAFSITSDSVYSYSNRIASLKWDHTFNEKNKGSLIFANSEYKFNIDYNGNSDKNFILGFKVNETQVKLKMKYDYSNKHKIDYGISTKLYVVNPGEIVPKGPVSVVETINIPEERGLESAVFISDDFKVDEKLVISAGIRLSMFTLLGKSSQKIFAEGQPRNEGTIIDTLNFKKNEAVKTFINPEIRASARYLISPSFSIKASYNNTYQYIHTLSTNTTVSPTDTWKLSDLNIKPQQANQYSLGFYKNLDGNAYEFSVEGYYKESKNILDYKVGANLLVNESIETEVLQGEGKAYGIELLIKKNKGDLNGWIGYTYSRSFLKLDSPFSEERVNGGNFFPANFDKPHDFSFVANYKLTKRFSFSANVVYQTGRPVTFPVGQFIFNNSEQVLFSDRNKFRIPDYYRLDLGFNIEGSHKIKQFVHSFWNISIYNVLGRNNPYSVFFVTENGKIKGYQSSIFNRAIPTITYNFKF
jgi:CarboxypepD_reg-like domain/TonB-dependent Receptor Plug Domain